MHISTPLLGMQKFMALNCFSPLFQTRFGEPTRESQTTSEESCKIHKKPQQNKPQPSPLKKKK